MKKINILITLFMLSISSMAQNFYDEGTIQKIEIVFTESNWDQLLDAQKAGDENYIMAKSVTINGEYFDSVGVKYKGNSTYSANQTKNPFHIELNTYKDHKYQDYTDIKLSNAAKDPSFLREVLSYKILRSYMEAPLSNYANVYVNGTLIGLYSNSEAVSKKFVSSRFGSKTNTFVKCNPIDGAGQGSTDLPNLVYLGSDSTPYYPAYEMKSDYGWNDLITLCDKLKNNVGEIEKYVDVDKVLWMLAFDNTLVNLDSYIGGFAQNYYLYKDNYGRFLPVVWDLNESFGTFSMTGSGNLNSTTSKQQMSHLLHASDANHPLVSKLLSISTYKKMYLAHIKTMLGDNFTNNGSYFTQGKALQTIISSAVQADGNKFYTYANFTNNLTTDITSGGGPGGSSTPGITNLMNGRYTYLMAQSDFTAAEPTITQLAVSDSMPSFGTTLTFTAKVVNETSVYFNHRTAQYAPFTKVQMYDDGMNGDGAANDDVYGVMVDMNAASMDFYYYAENSTIGKFSPTNAAHNFYNIQTASEAIGDVVINEFLASNSSSTVDQDGQNDDWIELYNKGDESVNLENYGLTDDKSKLATFIFPAGTVLKAGEYLVVWADRDLTQVGYHADFKLSADGESIYLTAPKLNILDSITFGTQTTDVSYGRFPNGTGHFEAMTPTFSAENKSGSVGISDITNTTIDFQLYPNPAHRSFTVNIGIASNENVSLSVFNVEGKELFSSTLTNTIEVDVSGWAAGMYFVKVGNTSKRLLIE